MPVGIDVSIVEQRAVVVLRGEIDGATSPAVERVLAFADERGCTHVTLDCDGVTFFNSHALRVIVSGAESLQQLESELVLRSPSMPVLRLLELTGLESSVPIDWASPDASPQPGAAVSSLLQGMATIPTVTDLVDAALAAVVVLAAATIAASDGASVTLRRHGQLATAASTSDLYLRLDEQQYESGGGPCVDAATNGERFHVPTVDSERRWPSFIADASRQGVGSILSTPLITGLGAVGALNLYAGSPDVFDRDAQELASLFADQAATMVGHGELESSSEQVASRLRAALEGPAHHRPSRRSAHGEHRCLCRRSTRHAAWEISSQRHPTRRRGATGHRCHTGFRSWLSGLSGRTAS